MKLYSKKTALAVAIVASGFAGQSFAAVTTTAGQSVSNTAKITGYQVGGVQQLTGGSTIDSNASTFVVDRKIGVTVTQVGSPVSVNAGTSNQAVKFTVTNDSNATLDFDLLAAQVTTGVGVPGGNDAADVSGSFKIYLDDGDGVFDSGDTEITATPTLDNLSAETITPGANVKTIFVVGNIPAAANGTHIGVSLQATAKETNGNALTQTAGNKNLDNTSLNTMFTLFADAAGVVTGDTAADAKHSAYASFVITPTVIVTKTSTVYWDPINYTTSPRAIPGSIIQYCIVVNNTGAASITNVAMDDEIPANTTYYNGNLGNGAPNAPAVATGTGNTCGSNVDGTSKGSYVATPTPKATVADFGTIATNGYVWAMFYVTVN